MMNETCTGQWPTSVLVILLVFKMDDYYRGRIEREQKKEDEENEPGLVPVLEYTPRSAAPKPFCVPLKSLEYLTENSPSRKHGVSQEQEEVWRRNCVDLIIKTGLKLQTYVDCGHRARNQSINHYF